MLKINRIEEGDKITFALEGKLDTITSPELEKEVNESINDVIDLVFDCKKLEYISSMGLRVLLAAQQAIEGNGNMKIINVNEEVMEIFEVTGFDSIFYIE